MYKTSAFLLGIILLISNIGKTAHAADQTAAIPNNISDQTATLEQYQTAIDWVQHKLDKTAANERVWRFSWMAGFGGIALGLYNGALAVKDKKDRGAILVSASIATLGTISQAMPKLKGVKAAKELAALPASSTTEAAFKLKEAERLLKLAAHRERLNRKWFIRIGLASVSITGGLISWLVLDRPVQAAISTAVGGTLGQLSVVTVPRTAIYALEEFYALGLNNPQLIEYNQRKTSWQIIPHLRGVALALQF